MKGSPLKIRGARPARQGLAGGGVMKDNVLMLEDVEERS